MCAINGFNFKNKELILRMNQSTSHRGPDGTDFFVDEQVSLGHNRLSIIDLSSAASQPMRSNSGRFTIVFNGEIYNFQDLKRELASSYSFKTDSDTEVILAAYEKWGADCVKKLNGIFALAIWDKDREEIFLARDHVGVKPLYYFHDGNKFIFSSEIKSILIHDIPRILNRDAFNHYFRLLYVPEPLTMFKSIYKFPAASFGILKNNKLTITKYWEVQSGDYFTESKSQLAEDLRERVAKSVKGQLISDRPLGIYLSGGIDSSAVLDCVSRVRSNIDTFSVGFELSADEQKEKFNQDFELAKKTAAYYGTNHHEVLLTQQDVLDLFDKAVWHMDEPISNPTAISMMKLAGFTKGKADVVLGGDGGDELFGGYERYRLSLAASYYQKTPSVVRRAISFGRNLKKLNTPPGIERFAMFIFQKENILQEVIKKDFLDSAVTKEFFKERYFGSLNKNFEEDFMDTDGKTWLVDFALMLTDKMSMSSAVEARVPLLDKDLVEFSARIPLSYKVNLFNTKIILKEAFKDRIPKFLLNQPKRGWFSPGAKWLRNEKIYSMAMDILSKNYYKETKLLFNWEELELILKRHYDKKEYNLNILWAILTFQIWAKIYNVRVD